MTYTRPIPASSVEGLALVRTEENPSDTHV
jgi:hypothetical protein